MRTRHLLLVIVLALVGAACGGDDTDTEGQTGSPTQTGEPTQTEAPAETETESPADGDMDEGAATVAVASSDLGDILVDGEGMTLYMFVPDDQGTPTCTEGCAQTWPPLEGPASAGTGADEALLGTVDHPEGATQVTYGGWPLYYFANDQAPGDTSGQGVGDNWYVVGPDGQPIQDAGGSAAGATTY